MEFPTVNLTSLGTTDIYGAAVVVGRPLPNGAIWLDYDEDLTLNVQLMLAEPDKDSTDINDFRAYSKSAKDNIVNCVSTINNMADALADCESVAQMDRYLVTTCGYVRQV